MSSTAERDLVQSGNNLTDWLRGKLPEASDVLVSGLHRPEGSGFSNDTLLCNLSHTQAGVSVTQKLVVRISPTGYPVFPFYDIPQQFDVMQAFEANTQIPVPTCLWKEYDKSILGEVFYVMEFLDGKVPPDNPPYLHQGFVMQLSPAERGAMWKNGIKQMAAIHQLDYKTAGLDFLAWPDSGKSAIAQHLDYFEHYLHWAARGKPQPVAEYTLQWLKDNMPTGEPDGIIWGDARFGNMMFRESEVCAVLDWEMVAIGNPEADLAWWIFVDWGLQRGNGNPEIGGPRPEGILSDAETVAWYEECVGREVKHLQYYQAFAGLRFAAVMIRIMQQQVLIGNLPAELGEALERNNAVTQLLAELLDLPAPQ